jgi:hypothetical protein
MNARVNQIGAIIFVNDDLTTNVEQAIQRQLEITDTMDGYEFDQRVLANPNYPAIIHNTPLRVLVIRAFTDYTNRQLADITIFVKAGLAYVEGGQNGPPAQSFQVDRMQLDKVLVAQMTAISGPGTPSLYPNVQSNVLYPLFDNDYSGYPFASEPINAVDDDDGDDEDDDDDFTTG